MSQQTSVLIIDDDKLVRNLISEALQDHYAILLAEDGEDGIIQSQQKNPDLILLDIEMPGLNGYEVCDQIKQNKATKDIPVVFLSSKSGVRERMLGYEVGASDFIVKPCDMAELRAKLQVLLDQVETQKLLASKYESAAQTAFTAMRGSSEFGLAIQFIEDSFNARSFPVLAERFLAVTENLGLKCSLMFDTRKGQLYFSNKGQVSPLEQDVINTLFEQKQRISDFGVRTQFNYHRVALLVKNMPLQDRDTYGRYKDFLPSMLGSTDSKIRSMDTEQALLEQTRNITECFSAVRGTLQAIGTDIQLNQERVISTLKSLLSEFDREIPRLGLEEDQELYLLSTLDHTMNSAQEIVESGQNAQASFSTVGRLLDHLSVRQHQLLGEVLAGFEKLNHDAHETDSPEAPTGDIELF